MNNKTSKKVAIVQSCYIPWKGYFDLIRSVDEFILFDDMQYTRRDWRNRNKIKTPQGAQWLTIPVEVKGKYHQAIKDTCISDPTWTASHWAALRQNYSRAPHFATYADAVEAMYQAVVKETHLSCVNHHFLRELCQLLGIQTRISWSMDYPPFEGKTERLVGLCRAAGATHYLSGPAARDYIAPELFAEANIQLDYIDYAGYPPYPQLWGEFDPYVSVLDLLFNTGPDAINYLSRT